MLKFINNTFCRIMIAADLWCQQLSDSLIYQIGQRRGRVILLNSIVELMLHRATSSNMNIWDILLPAYTVYKFTQCSDIMSTHELTLVNNSLIDVLIKGLSIYHIMVAQSLLMICRNIRQHYHPAFIWQRVSG